MPSFDADRVGVLASVLCAIHCAATPFLLLMLPTFGKFWAHPASHWGMAMIVVPIALLMMSKGYQRHRRAWILAIGIAGILLVIAGAFAPYFENASPSTGSPATSESNSDQSASGISEDGKCTDSCCPSLVTDEAGKQRLEVPTASVLTTAGGIFLIGTHLGNLCCCPSCRRKHRGKA
ncbi:MerC domain-containing protein [Haloferula sp.]|uniref:MerC domain-containing protein n=1 Tax=Haloferula sp. TaxID=2497595 RepID=UPI00329A890F